MRTSPNSHASRKSNRQRFRGLWRTSTVSWRMAVDVTIRKAPPRARRTIFPGALPGFASALSQTIVSRTTRQGLTAACPWPPVHRGPSRAGTPRAGWRVGERTPRPCAPRRRYRSAGAPGRARRRAWRGGPWWRCGGRRRQGRSSLHYSNYHRESQSLEGARLCRSCESEPDLAIPWPRSPTARSGPGDGTRACLLAGPPPPAVAPLRPRRSSDDHPIRA